MQMRKAGKSSTAKLLNTMYRIYGGDRAPFIMPYTKPIHYDPVHPYIHIYIPYVHNKYKHI